MRTARQLASVLADLLRRERDALAEFLAALADFDRKRAWVELGHGSLFAFLVKDLGLSNGAAAYRKAAVDLVQRFPQVLEPIRDGRLCLSTVFELAKVITAENAAEVLPRFFGASRRDAQDVAAELAPQPVPVRTIVTALPPPALGSPVPLHDPSGRLADRVRASAPVPDVVPPAAAPPPKRAEVEAKTAELSRVHLTVPRRLLQKLAAARDALSHSHFGASDAEVLEVGLDLVIERHRKRRGIGAKPRARKAAAATSPGLATAALAAPALASPARASPALTSPARGSPPALASDAPAGSRPPPSPAPRRSRHVPAAVAREVWERDRGCCVWPLEDGGVCGSTSQIQIDHIEGWALGAGMTPEELRLLCRFHQDVHARRLYGDERMDTHTRPKGPRCSEPVAAYGPADRRAATRPALRPSDRRALRRPCRCARASRPTALPPRTCRTP